METVISIPAIPAQSPAANNNGNTFLRLLDSNELVLLEMQGSVARLDESESRLGRLIREEDGRIYLTVGYQKMEGKVMDLRPPFAVLRKKRKQQEPVDSEMKNDDSRGPRESPGGVVEMEIVDVCRKKIYFGRRPEPMNEMDGEKSAGDENA